MAIELRDITKVYSIGDQAVHALGGISLDIADGELVAIMGAVRVWRIDTHEYHRLPGPTDHRDVPPRRR